MAAGSSTAATVTRAGNSLSHGECIINVRAALGPSGRGQTSAVNGRAEMGGLPARRLLFAALAVALAGALAVPTKLMPSPSVTRVAAAAGPSTLGSHPTTTLVPSPPPPSVAPTPR